MSAPNGELRDRRKRSRSYGAAVTVKLAAADFVSIADGQFDGRLAVASERIEIAGDRALAERMLELVDPDAA